MAGVLLRSGELIVLEAFVNMLAPQDLVLRLFTNNITPAETDDEGDYTEDSGDGYDHVDIAGASGWTWAAGDPSSLSYVECEFAYTGAGGNVYGYYITQVTSGIAVIAERFTDGPYNIQNSGDRILVTPSLTID
jgi:hypothetical protein